MGWQLVTTTMNAVNDIKITMKPLGTETSE